ncbi:BadM/Rrf2 family transcriptional Regulator [Raoultella ornithinolytica]|nr:BadM/Rrf2 family transcriptional Regulator [Raoultella ornithinolytica]
MLDYRFPTALQMVLSVAMAEQLGQRSTSAILAYGLEANPSFIRKLMVPLTRDGIIVSTLGRNGSIHLGRPAESITLRDIYVSVIEDKKLWASRPDVPARCVVSANACWYFKSIADEAEQASLDVLARHTVASALEKVKKGDTSGCELLPELDSLYKKNALILPSAQPMPSLRRHRLLIINELPTLPGGASLARAYRDYLIV